MVERTEVWNQFEFETLDLSENIAFCLKLCGGSKCKLTRNCSQGANLKVLLQGRSGKKEDWLHPMHFLLVGYVLFPAPSNHDFLVQSFHRVAVCSCAIFQLLQFIASRLCFLQLAVGSVLNSQQVEACYSGLHIYYSSRLHISARWFSEANRQGNRKIN